MLVFSKIYCPYCLKFRDRRCLHVHSTEWWWRDFRYFSLWIVAWRCLFVESILQNIVAHSRTLIWSTLCGNISSVSVTKKLQWPSHIEALRHGCLSCCFWNITGLRVTHGRIVEIVTRVSNITWIWCFPFTCAIYRAISSVRFVLGSLRHWPFLPDTSFSITLCISTDLPWNG